MSTKIPVPHDRMLGGINRSTASFEADPSSWYWQFNVRRGLEGLEQVPIAGSGTQVNDGEFDDDIGFGVLPPNRARVAMTVSLPYTYNFSAYSNEPTSFSVWGFGAYLHNLRFSLYDEEGNFVAESAEPWEPELNSIHGAVLGLDLTVGDYSMVIEAADYPPIGTVNIVHMGGPERIVEFGDSPVYQSALAHRKTSDSLYFYASEGGEPVLASVNIFFGGSTLATLPFDEGAVPVPILVNTADGEVLAVARDGVGYKVGFVGTTTGTWDMPSGFVPGGAVLDEVDDIVFFWDEEEKVVAKFVVSTKTFTTHTMTLDGVDIVGPFRYYNTTLFRIGQFAIYKTNSSLDFVAEISLYPRNFVEMYYNASLGKYFCYDRERVSAFMFNNLLAYIGPCIAPSFLYANETRKLLVSSCETQLSGLTFHTLRCTSMESLVDVEYHMLHPVNGPEVGLQNPIALWIPEIGRAVVLTGEALGIRLNFLA